MEQTLEARVQRFINTYSSPFEERADSHLHSMLDDAGYSKEGGNSMYRRMATRGEHTVIDVFDTHVFVNGSRECSYIQLDNLDEWTNYKEHKPISIASKGNVFLATGGGAGLGAVGGFLGAKALDWIITLSTIGLGSGFYEAVGTSIVIGGGVAGALVGSGLGITYYVLKQRRINTFYKKYEPRMIKGKDAILKALSAE